VLRLIYAETHMHDAADTYPIRLDVSEGKYRLASVARRSDRRVDM
jgi:hypothetical protein